MNYVKLVDVLNEELNKKGINPIYTLIANNTSIDVIESLMIKNTIEYNQLSEKDKKGLINFIKGLIFEKKLLGIN